jgi:hypothetical protein
MLLLLDLLLIAINPIISFHYRGSMITWRVLNQTSRTNLTIEILQRTRLEIL